MRENVEIIVGGDIVPTKSNMSFFEKGEMAQIVTPQIMNILNLADARIFNLETPICDYITPIEKEGPCFSTTTKSVAGIKALNPTLLTLANNHILDQGEEGLKSTAKILEENEIPYTGIGNNILEANEAFFIEIKGVTVGIYGCVEHEYSQATTKKMGANPFDPFDSIDAIKEAKKKCDFLLVLYHGGKEYYRYPSPELQKRAHKMVEAGANAIICQHSHCVGTVERFCDAFILYGQGNFILDRYVKAHEIYFQDALIVKLIISKDGFDYQLIPIIKDGSGIRCANEYESQKILGELSVRNSQILEEGFIEDNYVEYVKNCGYRYIYRMSRIGYIISSIDNRFFNGRLLNRDLKKYMGKHHRLAIQNCLQCEVHNELLRTYLDNRE